MKLLYAILPAVAVLPENLAGLEGKPVHLICEGELAFACSDGTSSVPTTEMLLAFAEVVDRLFAVSDLLPMRHGCVLEEAGIHELLRLRQADFLANLATVAGCLEMGARVLPPARPVEPAAEPATTGMAYLLARKAQLSLREACQEYAGQLQRELMDEFGGITRSITVETPRSEGQPYSIHFLLPRADRERFETIFRAFQLRRREKMILSGPWAPYSFTGPTGQAKA